MHFRSKVTVVLSVAVILGLVAPAAQAGWPITLSVQNSSTTNWNALPVTSGVPLAREHVTDLSQLSVQDAGGNPVPAQFLPLMTYKDGSYRWVLVDFQPTVPGSTTATYRIVRNATGPAHPTPLVITDGGTTLTVETGAATFVMNKVNFNLFDSVTVGGVPVIGSAGVNGIVVTKAADASLWWSNFGPATFTVEDAGPLHAVVKVVGDHRRFAGDASHLLEYTVRIHFYAGQSFVRVFYTLENQKRASHPGNRWDAGQGGYEDFKDASLQLRTTLGGTVNYMAQGNAGAAPLTGTVQGSTYLYQCSSGGAQWNHNHHMDRYYQRYHTYPGAFQGWRFYRDGVQVASGSRAVGWTDFSDGAKGVAVGARHFWQNCPKAVEINGSDIAIRPFPKYQNGDHGYEFEGGQHKTHECLLYFHAGAGVPQEVMANLNSPLFARCTEQHYADTYAFEFLGAYNPTDYPRLENYDFICINSITNNWEYYDEYGWEDFGCVVADHEHGSLGSSWWNANGINHYGNEYFATEGFAIQYARRGDPRFLEQAIVQARHMLDIHVYHTTDVAGDPAYAGGYFMHTTHSMPALRARHRIYAGECDADFLPQLDQTLYPQTPDDIWAPQYESGGPGDPGHLNPPYVYFFLTGDREGYDAILTTAAWSLRRGAVTGTRDRSSGNYIFNMLYAYQLTHDSRYRDKIIQTIAGNNYVSGNTGWGTSWHVDGLARFILWKRLNAEFDADYTTAVNSAIGWSNAYINSYVPSGSYWHYHDFDALSLLYLSLPEYHANRPTLLTKADADKPAAEAAIPTWYQSKDLSVLTNSGCPHMFIKEGRFAPPIPGDVDHNGKVEIFDVIDTIDAFGSVPGDPTWNAACDFDGGEQVDVFDVITVVINFGLQT